MEKEIEKAIRETLVISNPQSIHIAVKKILLLFSVSGQSEQLCRDLHSTDWYGKCFKCGKQVFEREPK